jgi:hypothetical protein
MMPTNKLPIYIHDFGDTKEWLWVASIDNNGGIPRIGDAMEVEVWIPGIQDELTERCVKKGFVRAVTWYTKSIVVTLEP